jgi:hypothetical protein
LHFSKALVELREALERVFSHALGRLRVGMRVFVNFVVVRLLNAS